MEEYKKIPWMFLRYIYNNITALIWKMCNIDGATQYKQGILGKTCGHRVLGSESHFKPKTQTYT